MLAVPSYPVAQTSRRGRKVALVAVALLAILFLCGVAGAVLVSSVVTARGPVEASVDAFMQALSRDDFDGAYAQFSTRAKRSIEAGEFEEYFSRRANRALFAGYQAAGIENINITFATNADPDAPQGQVAEVNGMLTYQDGFTGSFEAILEREGGEWHMDGIYITIPPEKLEAFLKEQP
jgi:hypothetical protein